MAENAGNTIWGGAGGGAGLDIRKLMLNNFGMTEGMSNEQLASSPWGKLFPWIGGGSPGMNGDGVTSGNSAYDAYLARHGRENPGGAPAQGAPTHTPAPELGQMVGTVGGAAPTAGNLPAGIMPMTPPQASTPGGPQAPAQAPIEPISGQPGQMIPERQNPATNPNNPFGGVNTPAITNLLAAKGIVPGMPEAAPQSPQGQLAQQFMHQIWGGQAPSPIQQLLPPAMGRPVPSAPPAIQPLTGQPNQLIPERQGSFSPFGG